MEIEELLRRGSGVSEFMVAVSVGCGVEGFRVQGSLPKGRSRSVVAALRGLDAVKRKKNIGKT